MIHSQTCDEAKPTWVCRCVWVYIQSLLTWTRLETRYDSTSRSPLHFLPLQHAVKLKRLRFDGNSNHSLTSFRSGLLPLGPQSWDWLLLILCCCSGSVCSILTFNLRKEQVQQLLEQSQRTGSESTREQHEESSCVSAPRWVQHITEKTQVLSAARSQELIQDHCETRSQAHSVSGRNTKDMIHWQTDGHCVNRL